MTLTFGKHKGEDTSVVPLDYLRWLEQQDWISDELREACNEEIKCRGGLETSRGRLRRWKE